MWGTLDAYYEANLDICAVAPIFNLYDKDWPMRTRPTSTRRKVCLRRNGPHGYGNQLGGLARMCGFGFGGAAERAFAGCSRKRYSDIDSSLLFQHVNVGGTAVSGAPSWIVMCTFRTAR